MNFDLPRITGINLHHLTKSGAIHQPLFWLEEIFNRPTNRKQPISPTSSPQKPFDLRRGGEVKVARKVGRKVKGDTSPDERMHLPSRWGQPVVPAYWLTLSH